MSGFLVSPAAPSNPVAVTRLMLDLFSHSQPEVYLRSVITDKKFHYKPLLLYSVKVSSLLVGFINTFSSYSLPNHIPFSSLWTLLLFFLLLTLLSAEHSAAEQLAC